MSVAGCVLALLAPARALAQTAGDEASSARIRIGPLGLTPQISITNFGMDTNVYRTSDSPTRDFMATMSPALSSWLHLGRAQVSARSSVQWIYFGQSASERSVGRSQSVQGELHLTRVTPTAGVSFLHTEQAASLELDQRVPQTTVTQHAGLGIELTPSVSVTADGSWTAYRLDRLADATETSYADSLDRHTAAATASFRYIATPLTTFVVKATSQQDRFDVSPLRNSDSLSVQPGVEFKPFALISGSAYVGIRRFRALDPSVPNYTGPTASVILNYTAADMTRVSVNVQRDLAYSYEVDQPYYLSTGADLSVTQMLGPNWDVVVRGGRTRLSYQNVIGVTTDLGRKDLMKSWGVGLGRHLPSGVRVGFDLDYLSRASEVSGRGFHGFRLGGTVTYGS